MKKISAVLPAMLIAGSLSAQTVVHKDNTVTFNYKNDNAKSVSVSVQFAGEHQMTKGDDGVWSITLGPAAPDIYPYSFIVDGISVMDPHSPGFFPNETFKNSLLDLNGADEDLIYEDRNVPHGEVDYLKYWSNTLGTWGNAIVYTPPFYDQHPEKTYPVMYLISGTTDTEEVYFKVGRMNTILDNLIAEGQAKEMIIVLPYGNPSLLPGFKRGRGDSFGGDLINDLMPYVEKNYRTINDRDHRAIGGFSRGGNQGLQNGLSHIDKFSWLCSYSSFTSTAIPEVYDRKDINDIIHLFWLGVGTDDFLYGNAKEYMDFLDSKGIKNTKVFTEGKFGHTWMNARYFLDKTFRLLFQDDATVSARIAQTTSAAPKPLAKVSDDQRLTASAMARLFPVQVVSPKFNEDGTVSFSINAPNASKVELDSPLAGDSKALTKDERGVWSITVKPEKADLYPYAFVVDGTRIADASNMYLSPDKGFKYSLVDIRGEQPSTIDIQDVPHGKLAYRWYNDGGSVKPLCVYTPAGYDPQGSEKYPVLYLKPGEADTYESWSKVGRANVILDNLIAGGHAKKMIAVMAETADASVKNFIDSNYKTLTGAEDSYVYAPAYGRSWMTTRESFIGLVPDLFKEGGISPVTNVNAAYPKILSDNSVMFRFRAPKDAEPVVDLGGKRYPMNYGPDGFWTVRTEPQVPGFHYYYLVVKGMRVADPASQSFYGASSWTSCIDIPEEGCELFEVQDVPHGQVREMQYYSKSCNQWRPILVYTPASYEKGKKKYPVVYIHHGGGEDYRGWIQQGRTANIIDNLIAQGKCEEMIVVSVDSNVPVPAGGRPGYNAEGMKPYRNELIDNIVPFIESTFRTKSDRHNRAMCGLSMGGGQSFYIGLRETDTFANVGMFSSGIFGGIQEANFDLETECPGITTNTAEFNKNHDLFYVSCGEQDPRISHTRKAVENMKSYGIDVYFNSYPGDHEWQVWRKSFAEFAQMIFK